MKHNQVKRIFLGLAFALVLDAGTPAFAFNLQAAIGKNNNFFYEEPIKNAELDNMRGGFITGNGMTIDFSFSANTLIDGQLINQIVLDTADLAASMDSLPSAESLRSIIQLGEGNTAFDEATDVNVLPGVLTVVQNNLDDLTIQQINFLDLSVNNVGNFTKQAFLPEIDFQNSLGLAP